MGGFDYQSAILIAPILLFALAATIFLKSLMRVVISAVTIGVLVFFLEYSGIGVTSHILNAAQEIPFTDIGSWIGSLL